MSSRSRPRSLRCLLYSALATPIRTPASWATGSAMFPSGSVSISGASPSEGGSSVNSISPAILGGVTPVGAS
ncbi:hypothetical protein PF005_g30162 [Phytophthora fragariae]|uniref:Uncharacterized protein n=1 Tax=Phytophthora fragariae TaxID=53985 RepID=A0A6A3DQD9_9STRA|nr:hypothetical protein PF003_g13541 [Phytophthora fragariae]KAE8920650.1 hypothetical protein PF009_g29061 [Phytophthora fragariae]KAE8956898.1 hypothetical protein PF011_g31323 [Phytophthora fragariae]KAE9061488.1 hypothetical protein PF010_g29797 [Phytophthora fragariae]KAE9065607.1 hypothetical protein PF006_g30428 [Phytophthora fragariae]